jgi:hypothetical protein
VELAAQQEQGGRGIGDETEGAPSQGGNTSSGPKLPSIPFKPVVKFGRNGWSKFVTGWES